MKLIKNKKLLYVSLVLLTLTFIIIFFVTKNSTSTPNGMRQVKSYDPNGICLAVNNPECGYCPNTPVDGKCYVKKGELEQYR